MTVYLSSAYLAPVEYYTKLLAYDHIYIEQYDHYTKQTYRNRCTIAGDDERFQYVNRVFFIGRLYPVVCS